MSDSASTAETTVVGLVSPRQPYTVWALDTTFTKRGFPVMGTLGASVKRVVIMEAETFKRLIAENPNLATAQFNIGTYEP